MGLIDKQNELLRKLHDTNYELFDGDKDEALDFVSDQLTAFPDYANVVIREQVMMPIWQNTCEGSEFRENVQRIDAQRRNAHDCAISSIDILNRVNSQLGLEPFCDIDTNDRHAVADTVGKYVSELYGDGSGKTFDDAVYGKTAEYDRKKISERLSNTVKSFETSGISSENTNNYELN